MPRRAAIRREASRPGREKRRPQTLAGVRGLKSWKPDGQPYSPKASRNRKSSQPGAISRHARGLPSRGRPGHGGRTMLLALMKSAVDQASSAADLDQLSRAVWRAFAAGELADDQAQALAEVIGARRASPRSAPTRSPRPTRFPRRRVQRSPDRAASRARRRALAATAPLPPAIAAHFTQGEAAAMKVVGDEVGRRGYCDKSLGEIAARAGVSRSTVQNALRQAVELGLVVVLVRPRAGQPNDTNLVRVVSLELAAWLRRGRVQNARPHGKDINRKAPAPTSSGPCGLASRARVSAPTAVDGGPPALKAPPTESGPGR